MGLCCVAHLVAKVIDDSPFAKNGIVTVTIYSLPIGHSQIKCDYCNAPAGFAVEPLSS